MPTRNEAWALLNEYTQNENLVRHMLAVEAAMRAYARKYGQDEELWGVVGLIHDFDYERHPDLSVEGHPVTGARILRLAGGDRPRRAGPRWRVHRRPARVADGKGTGGRG
jgi:putative nucleotidyltransferase with HDIG domain